MKFSCDRCQTRYSIGDEKVRGKILKIRCKTCGNIIVVRESTGIQQQAAVAASGGAGASAAYTPPQNGAPGATGPLPPIPQQGGARSAAQIEWFVAIKGKQHGPAKRDDVARLYHEGKITERTYLWHEGMGAWTRLKDVADLQFLLSEPAGKRAPPPPPPSDEGAEIVNFEAARQQRLKEQGAAPAHHDPFAAVTANSPGLDPTAPRDSTRVFIMQAGLANRGKKHRMYALAAGGAFAVLFGAMTLDYQGVIEIPGLHSVVNVVTQKKDPVIAPIQTVAWETGDEDPELKCKLFPNPEECKKQVAAANVERRKKRAAVAKAGGNPAGLTEAELAAAFAGGGPGSDPNLRSGQAPTDEFAGASNATEAEKIKNVFSKDGRGGPATPTSKMETPSVAGSNLDAANVASVVKNGASAVQACVESEAKSGNLPSGKQRLVLTVVPKGLVESARFENGAVSASPVGECIRGAAKKWKFAPFAGETTDIEIPLILSVSM
jgi:predicted Zn finger-like uncharacterized protein